VHSTWVDHLADLVAAELPAAVALRHRLHAEPRLSGDEDDTAEAVRAAIGVAGDRVAGTGRLLRLGPSDGPAVVLRAELDGLPLREETGVGWASTSDVMHACGHDVHCAAVAAVARAARRTELPCGVVVLLQPREESAPLGAVDVLADPAFTAHDVRAVIGAHVQPVLPRGTVGTSAGPVNASADELDIVVTGIGGHGAYPHRSVDPVLALAQIVVTLHHLVPRRVDPLDAAVLTVGEIHAGTAPNIIPNEARARATLRAMSPPDRERLHRAARDVVAHTAAAYGCTGTLTVAEGEPALVNDPALTLAGAAHLPGLGAQPAEFRSCGADDFAHYSAVLPSVMLFVGTDDGAPGAPGLHHPAFLPPDDVVGEVAMAYLAGLSGAVDLLRTGSTTTP
jgi:amidohydrolase